MSLGEGNVETITGYIDTDFSSGDSNKVKCKQFYQEENNNEIDELSKELSVMGCIVDAVKRPPNICIETCVYEEAGSDNDNNESHNNDNENDNEIHYSDEFEEEDMSEIEAVEKTQTVVNSKTATQINKGSVKLSKSQSSMSSHKPPSISGRSTNYGSVSVPPTRRINMSFTNERLREIERHNHILLNKILSARNKNKSSIPPREQPSRPVPSAAVHRKMQQRKIDHDNMILLKKIQRAKSSACSIRR
ncbi:unnamed protein product [Euphydryas editha]|uniref:Cilia- and flagella-associated protein 97 n=1 Tax=Euphydryas editha TaxID=104508 RepID=A0AAU9TLV2_EUPED|nr:unnamed protein product [Euphydryas editha]